MSLHNRSTGGTTSSSKLYIAPRRAPHGLVSHFPTSGPVQVLRGQARAPASPPTTPPILAPLVHHQSGGGSINPFPTSTPSTSDAVRLQPTRIVPSLGKQRPAPLEAAAVEALAMIERELKILLGDRYDSERSAAATGSTSYSQQRLSIFRSAARMLSPQMPPTLQRVLDRIVHEFEQTVASVVASERHNSFEAQRARLEMELRQHFREQASEQEALYDEKRRTIAATEHALEQRVKQLENQLTTATDEARRQKRQSADEAERFSQLAQSLVDARYNAQKAEVMFAEMQKRFDQVKTTERIYRDLLKDHNEMSLLLKDKKIAFKARVEFSVADLLGSDDDD